MSERHFANVLVVIDGSDAARRALTSALDLCQATDARLTVLARGQRMPKAATSIAEVEDAKRRRDQSLAASLDEANVFASYADVDIVTDSLGGPSWRNIVNYAAAHENDLIVMGYKPGLLSGRVLRSTVDSVVQHSSCPVMVIGGTVGTDENPGIGAVI